MSKYCPKCGAMTETGADICRYCGSNMNIPNFDEMPVPEYGPVVKPNFDDEPDNEETQFVPNYSAAPDEEETQF
ncbi:MAG: zinc ribbon domain-containing protein, partial [Eubacteriales bacterium]|nr:zinc ribbon domain-containing protein [Eubacteriales bacterium]